MPTIRRGINKMKLFRRMICGHFRPGLRATIKATMCLGIIQIRKLRSRPQGQQRTRPIKDFGDRGLSGLVGRMPTITSGVNKMPLFQRMLCSHFRARQGATSKATMCPEINSYENYGPVPKTEPCRPSIAGKSRQSKIGPGVFSVRHCPSPEGRHCE